MTFKKKSRKVLSNQLLTGVLAAQGGDMDDDIEFDEVDSDDSGSDDNLGDDIDAI